MQGNTQSNLAVFFQAGLMSPIAVHATSLKRMAFSADFEHLCYILTGENLVFTGKQAQLPLFVGLCSYVLLTQNFYCSVL